MATEGGALARGDGPIQVPEGGPEHGPADRLDRAFVSSVAWTAVAKWSAQVATWTSTIVVARLLTASDYGVIGLATVFMGVVAMLSEMGVGSSVLVLRDLTEAQIAQLNSFALVMGVGALCVTLLAAEPLGAFFNSPQLPAVMRVLGLTFVVGAFRSVPLAMLQRELQFKRLAAIDALASLAAAAVAVSLALAGFGYWALALSQVAMIAASAVLLLFYRRAAFAVPRWSSVRRAMTFSNRIVAGRMGWYVYSNSDFFIAGRVLGTAALGIYSFGWSLTSVALDKIGTLINAVTPAFFSAMQKDRAGMRRMLLGVTEVIALVVFPATIGAALVASDMVPLLFGDKWQGAVPVVQLLSVYGILRTLRPVQNNVLINIGEEGFLMWISIVSALIFPLAFLAASRYGPVGIAAVWAILYPVSMAVGYARLFKREVVTPREYAGALFPAGAATASMAVLVLLARHSVLADSSQLLRLLVSVPLGAATYAAVLWFGFRPRVERFVRLVKQARGARPAVAA